MRAKKFGVPLPDEAKKAVRAERFGLSNNTSTKGKSVISIGSVSFGVI